MSRKTPPLPFAAVVLAAGRGERAGGAVPKQFRPLAGKPLLRHSVEKLLRLGASEVAVAIREGRENLAKDTLKGLESVRIVRGGKTRQRSVANALEALSSAPPQLVLIHDAARPDIPRAVVERLLVALENHCGAIPVLPVVDSLARAQDGLMVERVDRDTLRRVQTPQAFRYPDILAAHRAWSGAPDATDDAQVLIAAGKAVALVDGDERLAKITFGGDFERAMSYSNRSAESIRVGQGFDVHRLVEGEELWLCGLRIAHERGLAGHSDADVALHAIVDALLGALGEGDIGEHFPPSDPKWRGAPSAKFVEFARARAAARGFVLANLDLTLICEEPRLAPHKPAMRARLAELLACDDSRINIKATTTEGLGFAGRGEGIAAQAIVALAPKA